MPFDSYENLKTAIADYLDRPDLTSQIPDFITLAEARHRRDLRTIDMVSRAQVTMTKGQDPYVALPPRYLSMRLLRLLTDPVSELQAVTPNQITQSRAGHLKATYGQPRFYTVHEEIEFDVSPDQEYALEIIYYNSFVPLSATAPTNPLLAKSPDAYLYGALIAAEPFLMHDQRIQVWAELYKTVVEGLATLSQRTKQGTPVNSRVHGGTP